MDWIQQWQSKLNKQNGVAPLVRTGGSRHTGLAALPYRNIHADFLTLSEGVSRINVKLKNIDGTEINGMGPDIAGDQVSALREKINQLKAGDILVLAGSIPQSMPDTIYMDIMADLQDKGVEIAVDATRDLLMNVLPYRPFLIKPNNHELGEIFGVELKKREEVMMLYANIEAPGILRWCENGAVSPRTQT